jgi:hypothetical protein
MHPPDEKRSQEDKATEANPSRSAEVLEVIEAYANDLREIIKKLLPAFQLSCRSHNSTS